MPASLRLFLLLAVLALACPVRAAEYPFGVELPKSDTDPYVGKKSNAFLWVPPRAAALRAVVLAPSNVIERRFCEDATIREWAAKEGVALLFFNAGWTNNEKPAPGQSKSMFDSSRLVDYLDAILGTLAEKSGYDELRRVPWIPIGHSGNSKFCEAVLRVAPERTLASIIVKGGMPTVPPDGSIKGLIGVPILNICGEFEEVIPPGAVRNGWFPEMQKRLAMVRAAAPESLMGGLVDRGGGHLDWEPDMSRYVALYLSKALATRLGDTGRNAPAAAYPLKPLAMNDGWLSDQQGVAPSAPATRYTGDRLAAFWHFDEEEARAWTALQNLDQGKAEQFIGFVQDGAFAPFWKGWGLQEIQFRPLEDGQSFKVAARFRDTVPTPFADAGAPLGHASTGALTYKVIGWAGNTEQTGPDTFRVRFDREGVNGRTTHILIGAFHPGDAHYRSMMAATRLQIPATNPGSPQKLVLPQPANVAAGTREVKLAASLDSGLKPDYYVSWGPAEMDGDTVRFTQIPARARFPIEVKVTAYHWGKATEPRVATATPITRTFFIEAR